MKNLRIAVLGLWMIAAVFGVLNMPFYYRLLSSVTAFSAAALIKASKDTQGHYKQISFAYLIGSVIWGLTDLMRAIAIAVPQAGILEEAARNCSFLPNCFFALGLLLFAYNEYNDLHFRRLTVHTAAIAFFVFMVVQKLLLFHYAGIDIRGIKTIGTMMYFFVIVFTIVLVFALFIQTNFKGHTRGTNLSAVMLVSFNLTELNRLFCYIAGIPYRSLIPSVIGLLGIAVYSWAQSDPDLIYRKPESEEVSPRDQVKSIYIWGNAGVFFLIGLILFAVGLFDTRDLYILMFMLMTYIVIFKSIQTTVYSDLLIEQQRQENQRLERMVEEKTCELKQANEMLKNISETDELTGLPNRRMLMNMIHAHDSKNPFGVLLMDLNYFKQINDNYGHDAGDLVLKTVGRRLMSIADEHVVPMRIGGDEFLVLVIKVGSKDIHKETVRVAEKICELMDEPIEAGETMITTSVSIGICFWPEHSMGIDMLYMIADNAMYEIKHKSDKSSYKIAELPKNN